PAHLLRLAGLLEHSNDSQQALNVYLMVINRYPNSGDCETALYRSAQCCWNILHDGAKAQRCLNEMLRRFPNGYMVSSGKALLKQISG
ncbi:MAG: tetratricopeptide repeat protein, partial [Armatimonadota bacterium]